MAELTVNGSTLGSSLQDLLMTDDLTPGDQPSYQVCKTIYSFHPLGAKMVDAPITMAQSQKREIAIPDSPEDFVRDAFLVEWDKIQADRLIANTRRVSRIYGIGSVALLAEGVPSNRPIDYRKLYDLTISFNILDPLNTAGSLVLDQNPNNMDFQKHAAITVSGQQYHRSRSCTVMNEDPLYIEYTSSAFGFVGRSVYQRALFPLKTFVQSMITDDMVTRKAGVLIAKIKQPGSIIDNLMQGMAGMKRALLKEAKTDNIISIDPDEDVQSLNFQNLEGPTGQARTNVIKNIATAADMPAVMLENETLTEGFGEGTEDAKQIARFVDRERIVMNPLYAFFDKIVQYRAWNPEFYKIVQAKYPDIWGSVGYNEAFYRWSNSFRAVWPNLLTEPDSEKIKTDDVKLRAVIAAAEVLLPELDPENKASLIQWMADNFNQNKLLFQEPLILDYEALAEYVPPEQEALGGDTDGPEKTGVGGSFKLDSDERRRRVRDALGGLSAAVTALPSRQRKAPR